LTGFREQDSKHGVRVKPQQSAQEEMLDLHELVEKGAIGVEGELTSRNEVAINPSHVQLQTLAHRQGPSSVLEAEDSIAGAPRFGRFDSVVARKHVFVDGGEPYTDVLEFVDQFDDMVPDAQRGDDRW
jgi:hypothetical protein